MAAYYDRDGNPLADVFAFAVLIEQADYQRVAVTEFSDKVRVSTVWLGIDHSFGLGGPPVIFETMVFGGPLDQGMDRYATEAQALAGHDQMVAKVRAQPSDGDR